MDKLTVDYDFCRRKTCFLNGFYVAPNKMLTRSKAKGGCVFELTDFADIEMKSVVIAHNIDELWEYKIDNKTIGEHFQMQDDYNYDNVWE